MELEREREGGEEREKQSRKLVLCTCANRAYDYHSRQEKKRRTYISYVAGFYISSLCITFIMPCCAQYSVSLFSRPYAEWGEKSGWQDRCMLTLLPSSLSLFSLERFLKMLWYNECTRYYLQKKKRFAHDARVLV
jgi:hypothetical protein